MAPIVNNVKGIHSSAHQRKARACMGIEFWGDRVMDFEIPEDIKTYLAELDAFIVREIKPLEEQDDNIRFFDHRREYARTDWDNDGQPRHEWEELLSEMRRRADAAGHLRFALPKEYGGHDGSNLAMAVMSEP